MAEIAINDVVDVVLANGSRIYKAVVKTLPTNTKQIWEVEDENGEIVHFSTHFIALVKKP